MTPAGKLQDHLKKRVQGSGGQYRKTRWEGRSGCPDCLIWWEWPCLAFIEIKAEGDRLGAVQFREIQRMRTAGIPVYIARTKEELDEIVEVVRKGVAPHHNP